MNAAVYSGTAAAVRSFVLSGLRTEFVGDEAPARMDAPDWIPAGSCAKFPLSDHAWQRRLIRDGVAS